jgi:hypothetical protein
MLFMRPHYHNNYKEYDNGANFANSKKLKRLAIRHL